ncbi:His-Xaa-Ser system radical SAM maturase HxsB [Pseudomonas sp. 478]|uniref:His-Xaa-Ser system radical SAM maturase HxsB n=1 Tax=unclassified Pseudomonas TaxID=196821 RepID=UPI000DACD349|nr:MULTISPECIES: His-Xaa-Ser system radical SAM maturase HxsB [unclassified Pseudomonas]PZX00842.1 His-Xaa-Ser system radical SAM maturase HxsB [Pseudomonas sp. 478]TCV49381.1 His-Xaa-Ser system radical SAM maturase HxsB [Pseudomonas sp. 460]
MSKFQKLEFYVQQRPYELLPFKFDRLNDDEYVITNMAGEYHVIPIPMLEPLISKTLPITSELIPTLRSKQFIRFTNEQAPLQLLALKIRTRLSRLAQFTNLHIFVVTLRCDHSCPYCQVSRQSESKGEFDMTTKMAEKSLDFVFRSPNPAIKIEFQGGEPLLNFEMVKYVVLEAKKRNLKEGRDLQFVIATTLSLLTDEVLVFCKQHNIVLSSSLDGPMDLHNANRPRPGRDSHQRFEEGLNKARAALGYDQVSALMTTTDKSLPRARDIIDEYLRLGFDGIFLRTLSPYGFAIKTKKFMSYDTERWLEFYKEGLEYIIELNKSGVRFVEQYSALVLTKMLTSGDPGFVDLMNPAGAGIAAIVFNYDGSVYASDESRMLAEMGDHTFRLGNILEHSYEEIILSDQLLDALENSFTLSAPMCSDCAFEPYCGAEPVYHHAMHKDLVARKPESSFCKRNMGIFKHLIGLMGSDEPTKRIFMGWANRC